VKLHGYCTQCRRVRLVRLSGHDIAMLGVRRFPSGICDDCATKPPARKGTRP
jgi:hypothetical protein